MIRIMRVGRLARRRGSDPQQKNIGVPLPPLDALSRHCYQPSGSPTVSLKALSPFAVRLRELSLAILAQALFIVRKEHPVQRQHSVAE